MSERSAGLLVHPTSLPGPFESGDLGPSANTFVDFAARAGARWWQMLPLGPVGHGWSPYAATSVFAGSANLVSLEWLARDGLLDANDPALKASEPGRNADFDASKGRRERALRAAFSAAMQRQDQRESLDDFRRRYAYWLSDYARFAAIKERHGGSPFFQWPDELKRRDRGALQSFELQFGEEIAFHEFVQMRFAQDLEALRAYAHERGVGLMGDAPIYVAHDSAEVWAHPELFLLDESKDPTVVAGVPPDMFSEDGQLWGNPLYDWAFHQRTGFGFWIARLEHQARAFDAVRLDHFIGFSRYWAVARGEQSARRGTFHDVPGDALFDTISRSLQRNGVPIVELVAEDLGVVTDAVKQLRDKYRLPGMNILQFSFAPGAHNEGSRPHNYALNSVVYTGTHDNDTVAGWFGGPPSDASNEVRANYEAERAFALEYLALPADTNAESGAAALVRAALQNQARTAIVPVQDLLGLGRDARMNRPGVASGNWSFRLLPDELSGDVADRFRKLVDLYGRAR